MTMTTTGVAAAGPPLPRVVDVRPTLDGSCVLVVNETVPVGSGQVLCFGGNTYGQAGAGDLQTRGNEAGEMGAQLVPVALGTGLEPVALECSPASHFCCATLRDANANATIAGIKCWGRNQYGQLGLGDAVARGHETCELGDNLPFVDLGPESADGANISQISLGSEHACALFSVNEQIKCWGSNLDGRLGYEDTMHRGDQINEMGSMLPFVNLGSGMRVAAVKAGYRSTCAIFHDASLKCWGDNGGGRLGLGDQVNRGGNATEMGDALANVDLGTESGATAVAMGAAHTCALLNDSDSSVKCWGWSNAGYGYGDTSTRGDEPGEMGDALPLVPVLNSSTPLSVTQLVAGQGRTCAHINDSSAKCWGSSVGGELGYEDTADRGDNGGEMGTSLPFIDFGPQMQVIELVSAAYHTCALLNNATWSQPQIKCWGQNEVGQLGLGDTLPRGNAASTMGSSLPVLSLAVGLPTPSQELCSTIEPSRTAIDMFVGSAATCAILPVDAGQPQAGGNVFLRCWGYNGYGALGLGHAQDIGLLPGDMGDALSNVSLGAPIMNVSEAGQSSTHMCAILAGTGDVKCWGENFYGQLGSEDTQSRGDDPGEMGAALPVVNLGSDFGGPSGVPLRQLSTARYSSCALAVNGSFKCWGRNHFGQLGYGNTTDRGDNAGEMGDNLPFVDIGTGVTALRLGLGAMHVCAITQGTHDLKCWGLNSAGQLGYDDTTNRGVEGGQMGDSLPTVFLGVGRTAIQVSCGLYFTCALLDDFTLKCWGANAKGQLGLGHTTDVGGSSGDMAALPTVNILGNDTATTQIMSVHCGGSSCCVLLSSGEAKCFGDNRDGQLGQGDTLNRGGAPFDMGENLTTVQLVGPSDSPLSIAHIGVGYFHVCAMLNDSSIKCFGHNGVGQLGLEHDATLGDDHDEMGAQLPFVNVGPASPTPAPTLAPTLSPTALPTPTPTTGPTPTPTVAPTLAPSTSPTPPPTPRPTLPLLAPVAQVLAFDGSTCSIQALPPCDLRCWGRNTFGQLGQGDTINRGGMPGQMGANLSVVDLGAGVTPRHNTTVSASASSWHSCHVLDPGSSVKCFGWGSSGRLGYGDENNRGDEPGEMGDALPVIDLGSSLPPILQLAQGGLHNCALFAQDFRIKCWGHNIFGQLGYEDASNRGDGAGEMGDSLPFVDLGKDLGTIELFAGRYHTCARLNNTHHGGLKCWGSNTYGQLGYGDTSNRGDDAGEMGETLPLVNVSSSGHSQVVQGDGGEHHTCVLLNNSALKCFGRGHNGRLGYGDVDWRGDGPGEMGDSLPAVDVLGSATGVQVIRVQCGSYHSCALISDGSLKCWGWGGNGQLGQESISDIGDGPGQMGELLPAIQLGGQSVVSLSLGNAHTCVRLNDSSVKCFGDNGQGQLGQGDTDDRGDNAGEMGSSLPVVNIGPVVTGSPTPAPTPRPTLPQLAPVVQVIALYETTCSIQAPPASDLRCWGHNNYGQLGQGDTINRGESPWDMGANLSAVDLGTGLTPRPNVSTTSMAGHSCLVLDPDGSVKCFGRNNNGQLGYGDTDDRGDNTGELGDALPASDLGSSLPPILQLAQGGLHNCVLFARNFRIKCWGYGFNGQLGYEDTDNRGDGAGEMGDSLPFVDLGTGLGAYELFVGESHTCARLNDTRQGGLKCWGSNFYGQLGYGDTNYRGDGASEMGDALPLVNLTSSGHVHVVQGDGGNFHTCVLLNDSAVKCFGDGSFGRLGYGDTADRGDDPGEMGDLLPVVDVLGSATGVHVARVLCGTYHSCALISDGSMKCWGHGFYGQLGQENTTDIGDGAGEMGDALPVIQLGDQSVVSASLGFCHTCVLLNDSSVKCFGRNNYGQLGQGDTNNRGDGVAEMGAVLPVVHIGPVVTSAPTLAPTATPTFSPTAVPTPMPTAGPTPTPTAAPTPAPSISPAPTPRATLPLLAPIAQVIALRDGTCSVQAIPASDLRCWGRNDYGQLGQGHNNTLGDSKWQMGGNLSAVDLGTGLTPRPNSTTATMARHVCLVLDPDDSVKCFGRGNSGQLGYGNTANRGDDPEELGDALPAVDLGSSLPPILRLAQGGYHSCVLFVHDFRVKCWGANGFGQLGYEDASNRGDEAGEMGDSLPFVELGTGLGVVELFAGSDHTCARLNDTRQGGLKCWGWNTNGQLGYGDTSNRGDDAGEMGVSLLTVNVSSSGHVHVLQGDGGELHTCVLLNNSAVKCFGSGGRGQLGYGDISNRGNSPGEMGDSLSALDVLGSATGVRVIRVQCGGHHSCALISDGSMKCWGYGLFGQLGQENTTDIGDGAGEMGDALPVIQLGAYGALSASLGRYHTCVRLNDSSVKCFGRNNYGQLGQGDTNNRGDGVAEMGAVLPVVDIGPATTSVPTPAPTLTPTPVPTISPAPTARPTLPLLAPVVQVIALYETTCSIQAPPASDLRCWGHNNYGQLGQGDTTTRGNSPWDMGANLSAVDLGTGLAPRPNTTTAGLSYHSCHVLDPGGAVKCFGQGLFGQLGYGDTNNRGDDPGELGDALPAVDLGSTTPPTLQLMQAGLHSCALFAQDFRIKCWGHNLYGQLGYENTTNRGDDPGEMGDSLPFVDLGTGRGAVELFAGSYHTCARLNDTRQGGLKCWGRNNDGQLGYGDTNDRGDGPGEMGGALSLVNVSSFGHIHVTQGDGGDHHTCVLLNDSTVKCFGRDSQGQLGYGDTVKRGDGPGEMGDSLPAVDVLGSAAGVHVIRLHCGEDHSCALISDGSMKCWGSGVWGQLGQESTNSIGDGAGEMGDSLSDIQLGQYTVVSVSLGFYHTCVRLNDSSVKCFGHNGYGQLGQGDMDIRGDNAGDMGSSLPVVDIGPVVTSVPTTAPTPTPTPVPTVSPAPTARPTLPLLTPVAQVLALFHSTCSIQAPPARDLRCWGRNDYGQLGQGDNTTLGDSKWEMGENLSAVNLGTGLTPRPNVTTTTMALHACHVFDPDGSVKCFGWGVSGQLGYGDSNNRGGNREEMGDALPVVDLGSSLPPIRQLAQGFQFNCVRFAQNLRVKCWGNNNFGQLGYEDVNDRGDGAGEMGDALPFVDLGTSVGAIELFVGVYHTCARLNGTHQGGLKCWGHSGWGQLGYADSSHRGDGVGELGDALPLVNVSTSGHVRVTQGDAGPGQTCILLNDSAVKCFGRGSDGELGYGDTANRGDDPGEMGDSLPAVDVLGSATGVQVVRVQCGGSHSCALISDGSLKCWGYGLDGQLGQENTNKIGDGAGEMGDSLPVVRLGAHEVMSALLGGYHTCVWLNDSSIKCFGYNFYGQLGQGDTNSRGNTIGDMGSSLPVVDIGPVVTFAPSPGPSRIPTPEPTISPSPVPSLTPTPAPTADPTSPPSAMPSQAPSVTPSPVPNTVPTPSLTPAPTQRLTLPQLAPVVQVIALYESTCSIQAPPASDLRCWGRNNYGQLGQGDIVDRGDSPFQMGANLSAVDLGTGLTPRPNTTTTSLSWHACYVLDPDDLVKCFGRGGSGRLGYGNTANRGDSPGQLGDALPVVDLGSSLPPILQLAQGGLHSCVLFVQHFRIKCWGYGFNGQLGYEDTNNRGDDAGEMGDSLPFVDLGTGLGAHELFVGQSHTCARLNDTRQGGLKCWGSNTGGQLGYGDISKRGDGAGEMGDALPLVSLTSSGHVHVAQGDGGFVHTCVVLNDSTVKCFGDGGYGRLGYGDTADRGDGPGEMGDSLPVVDVLGSATGVHVIRVHCGEHRSCALISDGSMKCWGYGFYGQLGQENSLSIGDDVGEMGDSLPVIQLGDKSVVLASLGRRHTCVRLNDSSVKCFGTNNYGQLGQGDTASRGGNAGEMGSSLPVVDIGPGATFAPSPAPSGLPTPAPTISPSPVPSLTPTQAPTVDPTLPPSAMPSQAPSMAPSPVPNTVPTPAPSTTPIAAVLAENEVPQVQAVVQGSDTVYVRWPAQSDPRMTVVGYRVAVQTAMVGSFVTVSEPIQNWTTVVGLSPAAQYGFKVAVVATGGVGRLSDQTAQVMTWNGSVGFFESTGVSVRIVSSEPLPGCHASAILDPAEDINALFGSSNPQCTLVNQRTARLALVNGATLAPGTVVRVWTNETFAFSAPANPTPITTSLSSASHVAWCDSWTADASSSTGVGGGVYPLSYSWWVSSLDAGNAAAVSEENTRLSSLSSTTNRVLFNATSFAHNSVVTVHVTVSSPAFNLSATTQADTNISALDQPTVSIVGSANRSVLSFQDLAIRTAMSAPECFSGSANSSVFSWVAVQGVMPAAATTMTRTLVIPALSLDVTQTYIFRMRMTLGDFPLLPAVTADVQVSTLLTPPVVALAGGTQRMVGCEANTTLDASSSYDPNVCGALQTCPLLIFTWTCVGCTDTSFDDVENDAALLQFRACDMVNRTTAFPEENATAMLQLDVAVYSTVSQLIASSGVETTVLAPEVPAPPVIVLDPIPGTVTPNDSITVCSGSNGTLDIADVETQTAAVSATGSYFTLSTAALQSGVQYQVALQDSATGVVAATSVALNDPPSLGTFIVSPNTAAGGEAVLDVFDLRSWGHIDDPAHMPLSMTFSWRDDSGYEAVLVQNTAEFSLADVSLPAGSSVSVYVRVEDRLGSSASLADTLAGELVVSVSSLPSAVDWNRPGAITSALQSWSAFSDELLSVVLLDGGEELGFEQLSLMAGLSPSTIQVQRMLNLVPDAFAAIPADELTLVTCSDAQAIATLTGVDAIESLLFLAQIADSGCGSGVFFAPATASEQYVSLADVSSTRFGLAEDTDISRNGVTLQVVAAITGSLASDAEFVDTRTSTVPDSAAFNTANTQVLSPVHNLELRPSTLPCSDLCNDWEGQANGTCTAQDLPANTSKLGEDTVTIMIDLDADSLDLDPVADKCGNKVYPEVRCMHVQLSDLVQAAVNGSANVTWSTEGCEVVERTKDSVTCSCSHLTAFAVGAIVNPGDGECGETQCEELGGTWGEIYDSPGYAFWLTMLCCAWVFILVTDAQWFYDPDTKQQRSKFTTLVFLSQLTIVLAVLRIGYYMLMLLAYGTAENGMACAEFGLKGSGSLVPPYALFAVHDIFYPVFLTMFASVFLYWLDLAEIVAVNIGKAQHMLFMQPETWHKVIVFNVFLVLYSAGLNTYLVILGNSDRGTSAAARGHLAFMAAVVLVEAALFLYGRQLLEKQSRDKSTMKKINMMSKVLCSMFAVLGLQLLVLAASPAVRHAESAFVLYSLVLPVYEVVMVRFLYSTMHDKGQKKANEALVEHKRRQQEIGAEHWLVIAASRWWNKVTGRKEEDAKDIKLVVPGSKSAHVSRIGDTGARGTNDDGTGKGIELHEVYSSGTTSEAKSGPRSGRFRPINKSGRLHGGANIDGAAELEEFRRATTSTRKLDGKLKRNSDGRGLQAKLGQPTAGKVARSPFAAQDRLQEPMSPGSPASASTRNVLHAASAVDLGPSSPRSALRVAALEGSTQRLARRQSQTSLEQFVAAGANDIDEEGDSAPGSSAGKSTP